MSGPPSIRKSILLSIARNSPYIQNPSFLLEYLSKNIKRFYSIRQAPGAFSFAYLAILALCVITVTSSITANAEQSAATGIRFGQHDMRGESEVDIVLRAAHSSVNGVSLIVRTPNKAIWKKAHSVALGLAKQGYPVSFVLAADGPDRLEVYAGSIEIGAIRSPGTNARSAQILRDEMIRAYNIAFESD